MASPLKSAFLQFHSIVGLAISLILGLMGMTGAMLAFEDEIVAALNRDSLRVEVRAAPVLTPDAVAARLQGVGKVGQIVLSSEPGAAVRVRFARGEGGERSSVYVDPYDGRVLSAVQGDGFFVTLRNLHRFLLLPGNGNGYGRTITGVAVVCLLVLLISGLVLRWPRRTGSLRTWLKPNLAIPGRPLHRSLHSVLGTWVMPVYAITILTALWWSFDWYKAGATWMLSSKPAAADSAARAANAPRESNAPRGPKGAGRAGAAEASPQSPAEPSLDRVWSTFLADQGSRYRIAYLQAPNGPGGVVRVRSVATDAPHEDARDEFRIDSATGRMVSADRYADKTAGERVLAGVLYIHRGAFLGLPGRIVFMMAAALMPFFTVTGFILYLSRRRLRAQSKPGRRRTVALVPGE